MNNREVKKEVQFDKLADTYDEELEQLLNPYIKGNDTSKFAEYKIQLLHSVLKGKRISGILDFGCGVGRSLFYFQKYFGRACVFYGCDVSLESVKMASNVMPEADLFVNSSIEQFENYFGGGIKGENVGMI